MTHSRLGRRRRSGQQRIQIGCGEDPSSLLHDKGQLLVGLRDDSDQASESATRRFPRRDSGQGADGIILQVASEHPRLAVRHVVYKLDLLHWSLTPVNLMSAS